ncbi:MAG: precorrin-8X methylmutase [Deltaproteobacteria bacterium]|nr:precorrin-8X methylmutase [Deltaproteobacteria bacterium]
MKRPAIHDFLANPLSGPEIEARSFAIIDREAPVHHFSAEEWEVVRRIIHTTGDFTSMTDITFSPGAIVSAVTALRNGKMIYTDSNMIRSGISLARLKAVYSGYARERIICYVDNEEVVRKATSQNLPRSFFAVQMAKSRLNGAIALFGNAPVALLEMNRLIIEDNIRPALVVGMPVGFVHVRESKEELLSTGVPFIILAGRRGGSPLAVSVIHALCTIAGRNQEPENGTGAENRLSGQ